MSTKRIDKKLLAELWETDMSVDDIAARLGLKGQFRSSTVRVAASRLRLPKKDGRRRKPKGEKAAPAVAAQEPYTPTVYPDVDATDAKEYGKRLRAEAATDNTCRWPIGDPQHADFRFCGAKRVSGRPYCETHTRKAYQPGTKPKVVVRFRET
jgi:GcrA cell cycle regulator